MEPIIAKCGYRCDLCPVYKTNLKSDADKQQMCDAWAKYLGSKAQPEEITGCKGCQAEGNQGDENCPVRPCAVAKGLANCAYCGDFACDKLKERMNLVEEKVKDQSNIPEEDYDLFIKPFISKDCLLKIRESLET